MNNIFKCIGIVCLVVFSFFYTNKAISFNDENDPIMKSILTFKENDYKKCIEGQKTKDGVVLRVMGKEVNIVKSYYNMRGIGFNEDLLVYNEDECEITNTSSLDNYIIGGNKVKNSVSILLIVNDGTLLENFVSICDKKDVKISFVVNGSTLETNKDLFKKLINNKYDVLYNGTDDADLKKFRKIMNEISDNKSYCVYSSNNNLLNMCSSYNINTIKSDVLIEKELLKNVKMYSSKGTFLLIKENSYIKNELSASINYIKAKGLNITTITKHLSDY